MQGHLLNINRLLPCNGGHPQPSYHWTLCPGIIARQCDTSRGVGRHTITIKAKGMASLFNVVLGGIERPIFSFLKFGNKKLSL